ncbi:MAG: VWA domain-containing protein [Acidobacteriota bacterium]
MISFGRGLRVAIFLLISAAGVWGQTEEVYSVDSSIVILNATIADSTGRHVSGLAQNQFRVFEDGTEQHVSYFAAEETAFAAVILLDTSGSMEERVSLARAAAIRFLDGLRSSDNAALYAFDSKVSLIQPFSNSRDVVEKIFDLKSKGMTVLNDAVFEAAGELSKRPEKRRAIIVLSDGEDTLSKKSDDKALKAALAANASIYTIDMSSIAMPPAQRSRSQSALKKFSEKTGGTFVATPGGAAMRDAFRNIVDELGVQYTIGYQPAAKKDGKWHALELRVSRPGLTIRTRKGYVAQSAR